MAMRSTGYNTYIHITIGNLLTLLKGMHLTGAKLRGQHLKAWKETLREAIKQQVKLRIIVLTWRDRKLAVLVREHMPAADIVVDV